ncbi:hypothetical protein [Halorussus pelagicus]|uniref:hypothetical protein n=1 Tax=Halorussus pelagicus TaxID=2505977 RepID=UPI000FFBC6C9|nr:hypothetical protein [Halorussus pelagicus]
MNVGSLRAEGWQDAIAFLLMTVVTLFFWYINDMHFDWLVFLTGIGAGVIAYFAYAFAEGRPLAGFPIAMVFVFTMITAVMVKTLVVGAVAALIVVTTFKIYKTYF